MVVGETSSKTTTNLNMARKKTRGVICVSRHGCNANWDVGRRPIRHQDRRPCHNDNRDITARASGKEDSGAPHRQRGSARLHAG
uniref:Uncharacterized protein n=1 Tax=Gasterosteus aculeatus TaxID=69293 RepID=G3NRV0_GASAC